MATHMQENWRSAFILWFCSVPKGMRGQGYSSWGQDGVRGDSSIHWNHVYLRGLPFFVSVGQVGSWQPYSPRDRGMNFDITSWSQYYIRRTWYLPCWSLSSLHSIVFEELRWVVPKLPISFVKLGLPSLKWPTLNFQFLFIWKYSSN